MSDTLIDKVLCTGCGLCKDVCPVKCITLKEDDLAAVYPEADKSKCINCRRCFDICPALNFEPENLKSPRTLYVAWNKNNSVRRRSASGGIASGFYSYAFAKGWHATGAKFDSKNKLTMTLLTGDTFDDNCRNSKYVYCSIQVYSEVIARLKHGTPVLFIGLPCQVAAMKQYADKAGLNEQLVTVDLICHGVAPERYLQDHIKHIGTKKGRRIRKVFFRDPEYGTNNFMFSLYDDKDACIYKKRVLSGDVYQNGYHSAVIYRENCYNCKYARAERISDITIGDFSGLGRLQPYKGDKTKISSVLINTDRGEEFWKNSSHLFQFELRPLDEALRFEKQLLHPSIKTSMYDTFAEVYRAEADFDKAVRKALSWQIKKGELYSFFHIFELKAVLRPIIRKVLQRNE